jgi:hypothetical protein
MPLLELVSEHPDWMGALGVALTRPPGVPERRAGEDPFEPSAAAPTQTQVAERPRRISDDLVWLRQAIDEPETHGLSHIADSAAVDAWRADPTAVEHLVRLRERHVLDAAGFLLHDDDLS